MEREIAAEKAAHDQWLANEQQKREEKTKTSSVPNNPEAEAAEEVKAAKKKAEEEAQKKQQEAQERHIKNTANAQQQKYYQAADALDPEQKVGSLAREIITALENSGDETAAKAAEVLKKELKEAIDSGDLSGFKKKLMDNPLDPNGKIPKNIQDLVQNIINTNKDMEGYAKKVQEKNAAAQSTPALEAQNRISGLLHDISNLREAASDSFSLQTHTNDLISRGGGMGMQSVDASNAIKQLNAILEIRKKLNEIKDLQARNGRFFQAY